MNSTTVMIWGVAAAATFGIVVRPWRLPEFIWALSGAVLLVVTGLLSWREALTGVAKGNDVYFFLVGMMLLAEAAREEGLFDWLAGHAVRTANGSGHRLFLIVYGVGTVVTVFLSNDATAVVLTPAVYAAAKKAKAEPLPYLLVCAFIANAASFVLPISNPANLVVFGDAMPPLASWLRSFACPSALAIAATYASLRFNQRTALDGKIASVEDVMPLGLGGWTAGVGILATAVILMAVSATGHDLGLPTFLAGTVVAVLVAVVGRQSPVTLLRGVAWSVLPLVAGLFVLVEGLQTTPVLQDLVRMMQAGTAEAPLLTAWSAGLSTALGSNLVNNLPMGLLAATTAQAASAPGLIRGAILIGIDLGPNLSVTGSLATILWLIALRREGEHISAVRFLKIGLVVMPPALLLALAALIHL